MSLTFSKYIVYVSWIGNVQKIQRFYSFVSVFVLLFTKISKGNKKFSLVLDTEMPVCHFLSKSIYWTETDCFKNLVGKKCWILKECLEEKYENVNNFGVILEI